MDKDNLVEITQLLTLAAVARHGSFSKAAEELRVTQSAISQSIKNLENKVKVKLFFRAGKKVLLTSEGERLCQLAGEVLHNIDEAIDDIHGAKNSMLGKIRLGTLNGVGKTWLGTKVLEFSTLYPQVNLSLILDFQEALVHDFERNRLDFLVLPEYALPHGGEKLFLMDEKSTLVVPKNADFHVHEDMSLEEIEKLPFILFQQDDPLLFQWFKGRYGQIPQKIKPKIIINSHGYLLQAVARGLGVAVVPNHVLNRSSQKDHVIELGKNFEVTHYKFFLVYHKDNQEILRYAKMQEFLANISYQTF